MHKVILVCVQTLSCLLVSFAAACDDTPLELLEAYCFDCHDRGIQEGGLDLTELLEHQDFDGTLLFENLITEKMPPSKADQPSKKERQQLLNWLEKRQPKQSHNNYRRISRHEYNKSLNDLLGIELDLADTVADDRGTNQFDSDRRILLTREMLSAYFAVADQKLEFAFPRNGFLPETIWQTSKIKDSHNTYNIYNHPFQEGILFSWTRANNGNNYSFFYDDFEAPVGGWYEFTFDAAKVGNFEEDVSIQVYAGKYFFADDRPQPQRLLDVISLSSPDLKSHTVRGFLQPGENVSVHCTSKHTWRKKNATEGAYIKQLTVRGPLYEWPAKPYQQVFEKLKLEIPQRKTIKADLGTSLLEKIGGSVSVSSFQEGMEKEKMLDGSNRSFWHTRFEPTLAKAPHFAVLRHPGEATITGLRYSAWSGGNGNGQVKAYEVYLSHDGVDWGSPIAKGELETQLAAEQRIQFPQPTKMRFIKFLVTDAHSIDGRSLASIGSLDVITDLSKQAELANIKIVSATKDDLKSVILRFAERAFVAPVSEESLQPYIAISLEDFKKNGDFVSAAKLGIKSIICSHRFLYVSQNRPPDSYQIARDLARTIWLSIPDERLMGLAKTNGLSQKVVRNEIDRMLADKKSSRMIHSLCDQWLNLRSFRKVSPSLKLYPLYDDLLDYYLPQETETYLSHIINDNLPVQTLIDSDFSFLNQRLAQHYDIDNVIGQELRKVILPIGSSRGGLLTMGSVLKVTTDGYDTSPILRGAWISENIAGNTLSPPPETVKAIEPDISGATTIREQIKLHKNSATCAACHRSIDPYGFALEGFDATGKRREKYRIKNPHSGTFQYRPEGYYKLADAVDSSGRIGEERFDDVNGFKSVLLSDHKRIAYNFMKKFFEYANGYQPTFAQRLQLFHCIPDDPDDCRLKDLVKSVLVISFVGERIEDHRAKN